MKAQARIAEESKKRVEAEKRRKANADREVMERAKEAVLALLSQARLALAAEYRERDGAGRPSSWDNKKENFRDALERIQFSVWLQKRLTCSEAVESQSVKNN